MIPSIHPPLSTLRLAALTIACAWSIIAFAFGSSLFSSLTWPCTDINLAIDAYVKSRHDQHLVSALAPQGAVANLGDGGAFILPIYSHHLQPLSRCFQYWRGHSHSLPRHLHHHLPVYSYASHSPYVIQQLPLYCLPGRYSCLSRCLALCRSRSIYLLLQHAQCHRDRIYQRTTSSAIHRWRLDSDSRKTKWS